MKPFLIGNKWPRALQLPQGVRFQPSTCFCALTEMDIKNCKSSEKNLVLGPFHISLIWSGPLDVLVWAKSIFQVKPHADHNLNQTAKPWSSEEVDLAWIQLNHVLVHFWGENIFGWFGLSDLLQEVSGGYRQVIRVVRSVWSNDRENDCGYTQSRQQLEQYSY